MGMAYNIPEQMLACQIVEFNKPYEVNTVPTPKILEPHDVLVKIAVASYCHTDAMAHAGVFGTQLPCTGSHEGAGTVVAVGSEVDNLKCGDRILCTVLPVSCGECSDCLRGEDWRQYCSKPGGSALGLTRDGAFAEYAVVDSRTTAKIPDAVSSQTAAPLSCAGSTMWRGILQSELRPGQWLAIVGSGGGLGHIGIRFAKAKGIKVIGIDARDEGISLSVKAGADVVIDARKGQQAVLEEVLAATTGYADGVNATINVADAENAVEMACAVTRKHGWMIQIAQPEKVCIPFSQIVFRDIKVKGSLVSSAQELKDMLCFVAEKHIAVETTTVYGLKNVPKLLELGHSGKIRGKGSVVIDSQQR